VTPPRVQPYRLFEVTGIEVEYAIVDRALRPRCLVEQALRRLAGRPTSEVRSGKVGFSNEFAAHVLEIKTWDPVRSLADAEASLYTGLSHLIGLLRDEFGACLLPTGMHPFIRPTETTLWRRAGRRIYQAYAQLFPIYQHGWMNLQCSHINLPFGAETETVALHNAIACLLPYLPALSASSPIYEGRLGPYVDNRLAFYRRNQASLPQITGRVIPEFMTSYRQYRREILGVIYQALNELPGGEILRHEWVNSRGAILRFDRRAIEIRILDTQECIKMDIAMIVFIRGVLKRMVNQLLEGTLSLPDQAMLVQDFTNVIRRGTRAPIHAVHLRPPSDRRGRTTTPTSLLLRLLEMAQQETRASERDYLRLVEARIRRGNLSERIARAVTRGRKKGHAQRTSTIRRVYTELIDCLESNTPWEG
jgi:gamma-glutamyl:cysteine ligase YbdK (ATP-grasp superfamily)